MSKVIFAALTGLVVLGALPASSMPPVTEIEVEARVIRMPEGLRGQWQIGPLRFVSNADTAFENDDCTLQAGGFAEVTARYNGQQWVASEVECEAEAFVNPRIELEGPLTWRSQKAGRWQIGPQAFVVTSLTRLDDPACLRPGAQLAMEGHYNGTEWLAHALGCDD
ncbi:MAG: hypothetical protein IGS03_10610 [Candidatus Sericytochromatia bacterium]|nr:hypothetical protein [Candidatus Sericytochromatia bacterium]